MKRFTQNSKARGLRRTIRALLVSLLIGAALPSPELLAQVPLAPLSVNQNYFLFNRASVSSPLFTPGINWFSAAGVPISSVTNAAAGSNGRAPTPASQLAFGNGTNTLVFPTNVPTVNQYKSFLGFGAVAMGTNFSQLNSNVSFSQNVLNLNWAVSTDNGTVRGILRAAQFGAPYVNQQTTYPFGSVLPPPLVSETGAALTNGLNLTYWQTAPLGWQTNLAYYFSTNANAVFATLAGQATVIWQKAVPTNSPPPAGSLPPNFGYLSNSSSYYLLYTNAYYVSSFPVKPAQKMYWTEGNYAATGHPVKVQPAAINQINIIYNSAFPAHVAAPGDLAQVFLPYATNTLWFDNSLNELRADNIQGEVFVELLGEQLENGRRFLGFEVVNLSAAPAPLTVNVELGTRVGAFPDGSDDSQLTPAPILGGNPASFYYKQVLPNGIVTLYATKVTTNPNDFQCYWLNTGVAGLQWPYLFNRYAAYWPTNASHYVNYARPLVASAAEAAATSVRLPASEAPSIAFQDVFGNQSLASLDSAGNFYTFLSLDHPAHRTLLQFLSGNNVFYERVFSWLDRSLDTNSLLTGSVATNLTEWNPTNQALNFKDLSIAPCVITNTVNVGDRITAPPGEIGSQGTNYLAGYLVQQTGNDFNPNAYINPFTAGFAAANKGAIIPVNAIPGSNTLEVIWFRSDNANTALGFQSSYWPAVIGYYQAQWPAATTNQIILANNAGSGSLAGLVSASIYAQNNRALPGYNPNEEHAILLGDTAYALRDDLNQTNATGYSSAPFVLVQYLAQDLRPAMVAFQVRREAPELGQVFDYVVNAGTTVQAPMPLPLLAKPVLGNGASAINFNTAPLATTGDLPVNWSNAPTASPLSHYSGFTYQDRKHEFWVYRGQNAGLPVLRVGAYNPINGTFDNLPPATAVVGSGFTYYLHVSRPIDGLTISSTPALPAGLAITANVTNGLYISGIPVTTSSNSYTLGFQDTDGSTTKATLSLNIVANSSVVSQGLLSIANTYKLGALPPATAVMGSNFRYYLEILPANGFSASSTPPLPAGLSFKSDITNGLYISGIPTVPGSNSFRISVTDINGSSATNLSLNVVANASVFAQGPLAVTSSNQYSGVSVTFSNRPPFLAAAPTLTNSFTMRFYYVNQPDFDWPGLGHPPPDGDIVPYLLPPAPGGGFTGNPAANSSRSLDIVYRPVWPSLVNRQPVPALYSGQTLTTAINGLTEVRGQSSVQVLYQQSIATNDITQPDQYQSVTLFDPTVQKQAYLPDFGLTNIPGGVLGVLPTSVISQSDQGKIYFANLPPNLVNRIWLDPNTTNLVLDGQFVKPTVGDTYLFLNVLNGADLAAVQGLCTTGDPAYQNWTNAVANLVVNLYTFGEATNAIGAPIPGSYVAKPELTRDFVSDEVVSITSTEQQVDSYALAATGPGLGYISYIVNNSINPTGSGNPVSVCIARVAEYVQATSPPGLYPGQLVTVLSPNPLSESISFQHTLDLGGKTANYQYDWRIQPPQNGLAPTTDPSTWQPLTSGNDIAHFTLAGASGVLSLSDNFVAVRYREIDSAAAAANTNWSVWTTPAFAPGYIKRVLTGINPYQQTTSDLFNNPINTTANILTTAGRRWEGDVALNANSLTNAGLIQIYETVLHRGEALSINAAVPVNYGPANDALLLAAGEISDLYAFVASDAAADAANPTIGIGTTSTTYGSTATALFSFEGQEPSLLEEELALMRGRDDSVTPVTLAPVYNRLYWNYVHDIAPGEVIYTQNYNILDQNNDGKVDAEDAAVLFPMGHGDAYGHYLTALGNYYGLLTNPKFDWVPKAETISILGASVAVNYQHERKFAASAGALAQAGLKVFDLTWRQGYQPGTSRGWNSFHGISTNPVPRVYRNGTATNTVAKYWGLDHWAGRTGLGAMLNWAVGNAILPPVDPNSSHQGIQKVDRTTVPELTQLPQIAGQLQMDMDNADAGFTPFNLSQNAIPFDINPLQVTGANPQTHFEQIYQRAVVALNNATVAFNDAQNVADEMRSQEDSLSDFQSGVLSQEVAYNNQLIEIYGTPYPNDLGPGATYPQGYNGPDLVHYTYVGDPNPNFNGNVFGNILPDPHVAQTNYVDIQSLPNGWNTNFAFALATSVSAGYTNPANKFSLPLVIGPDGFFDKPAGWTSPRSSPGQIQQAISALLAAQDALRQSIANSIVDKQSLDLAQTAFTSLVLGNALQANLLANDSLNLQRDINNSTEAYNILNQVLNADLTIVTDNANAVAAGIPSILIAGTSVGSDAGAPAKGAAFLAALIPAFVDLGINVAAYTAYSVALTVLQDDILNNSIGINNLNLDADIKNGLVSLVAQENSLQNDLITINQNFRAFSDAQAAYQAILAKGQRIQSDRATWRQKAAAVVQGYRTRDAAFRLFQSEKLQRYLTLFDLAGRYAYLAAQAYDYETGLLGTQTGQSFLKQIISAQALGVVSGGVPQYSSSASGDPGLAGALAEMKADWDVLKGRLGFNNPDGYGTTVSLRAENYRILSGTNGDLAWQQVLQQGRVADVTADSDVRRLCLQIGNDDGSPVPGIILTFGTTITKGKNLFGQELAPGDSFYSSSSFATKIFSAGVCLDGYIGMNNPVVGGGVSPPDPTLDPNALARTPYVYLIPVGQDFMRSPPLGDASAIRSWNVEDVAVPLPFNISAANFASHPFYNSSSSLSEPLFSIREHQAFRPVSTTAVFNTGIYGATGALQPTEYTNKRLIGRSIWNSKWKLVIPGYNLLNNPNQGLDRFINSVKDVKLYFITYSYAGN